MSRLTTPRRWRRYGLISGISVYFAGLITLLCVRLVTQPGTGVLALLNTFSFWLHVPLLVVVPLALWLRKFYTVFPALVLTATTLLWIVGPMLPKPQRDIPTGDSLKLVTFNLNTNNRQIEDIVEWLYTVQPDVIVLQEVSYAGAVRRPLDELERLLPYQFYFENSVLFSRFPIVEDETRTVVLRKTIKSRTLVRTVLTLESGPVAVYGVHLSSPRMSRGQYSERARNMQIARLQDWLAQETLPYVVAGDFNLSEYSAIYRELVPAMQDAFRTAGTGPGFTWELSELPFLVLRLDYVFTDPALGVVSARVGPYLYSDHRPLVVELTVPPVD